MGKREYELPFGELIDKLTITQLRELLLNTDKYATEIWQLEHDIDDILTAKDMVPGAGPFNARFIRIVFLMAQLNTLIWTFKDKMSGDPNTEEYIKHLKLAHQVNGLKNSLKNMLSQLVGEGELKTNIKTDGLEYHISI